MAATPPAIPQARELGPNTRGVLTECAATREELRALKEKMQATLSSARAGLHEANRDLASATVHVRALLAR